jgi:hypothetical protein
LVGSSSQRWRKENRAAAPSYQNAKADSFKENVSENTEKIIDYISINYSKKTQYEIDLELLQQGFSASEMEAGWEYFYEAKKFWQKV